jgi:hypothetical protein
MKYAVLIMAAPIALAYGYAVVQSSMASIAPNFLMVKRPLIELETVAQFPPETHRFDASSGASADRPPSSQSKGKEPMAMHAKTEFAHLPQP